MGRLSYKSVDMLVMVKNGSCSLVSISSSDMVPVAASDRFMAIKKVFTASLVAVDTRVADRVVILV